MDWQSFVVYGMVIVASGILARVLYRSWTGKSTSPSCPSCGDGCGIQENE